MALNRVRVIWTGTPAVGDGLSTFYFNSAVGTPAQQVAAVNTFLDSVAASYADNLSWSTEQEVATINEATGNLEGLASVTPATGVGLDATDQLSPATQGLLRLAGAMIVGGRLLRGRLFLPGPCEGVNSPGGIPLLAYRTDYQDAAAVMIADANVEWRIWSRTHGVSGDVVTATVWDKWAVLRSRRD